MWVNQAHADRHTNRIANSHTYFYTSTSYYTSYYTSYARSTYSGKRADERLADNADSYALILLAFPCGNDVRGTLKLTRMIADDQNVNPIQRDFLSPKTSANRQLGFIPLSDKSFHRLNFAIVFAIGHADVSTLGDDHLPGAFTDKPINPCDHLPACHDRDTRGFHLFISNEPVHLVHLFRGHAGFCAHDDGQDFDVCDSRFALEAAAANGERCLAKRVNPAPRHSFLIVAVAIGDGDVRISNQRIGIDLIAVELRGGMCEHGAHRVEHECRCDEKRKIKSCATWGHGSISSFLEL